MSKVLRRLGITLAVLYLAAATFLFAFQRSFIYLPRTVHTALTEVALTGATEEAITTADGIQIIAWYSPPPAGAPTLVFFHGNGGFIAAFADHIRHGQEKGYGVMLVEYRGYSGLAG